MKVVPHREYSAEEVRAKLLSAISQLAISYTNHASLSNEERLRYMAASILSIIDGINGDLPAFVLVPENTKTDIACYGDLHKNTQITADAAKFTKYVLSKVEYWQGCLKEMHLLEAINGMTYDILLAIDGKAEGLPRYHLAASGLEEDMQRCLEEGGCYYPVNCNVEREPIKGDISGNLADYCKMSMPILLESVKAKDMGKLLLPKKSFSVKDKVYVIAGKPDWIASSLQQKGLNVEIVNIGDRPSITEGTVARQQCGDDSFNYYILKSDAKKISAIEIGARGLAKSSQAVTHMAVNL